jgi:undecaprenyl phosphate-alpha-L-ara4FN deformylase
MTPMQIALKVDVDTFIGTRDGVPRLARILERLNAPATFLFSLGPDHTGRAIRRAFRPGFLRKARRTSVLSHYGLRTLLYGTLLPGPHIAHHCGGLMRWVARRGFEVGVHCYDHVEWQDKVAQANANWTRAQLKKAIGAFESVFEQAPLVHGAAGWQINRHALEAERDLGFTYASDTRGDGPFLPIINDRDVGIPQLPTTLPTFDELIGRTDLIAPTPAEHLLRLTETPPRAPHVYTLHAELEGGRYLHAFERLLMGWQAQGYRFESLGSLYQSLDVRRLPRCSVVAGSVPGRSGVVFCQAVSPPPSSTQSAWAATDC